MCNRYILSKNYSDLVEELKIPAAADFTEGSFSKNNIAPTDKVAAVVNRGNGELELQSLVWGYSPGWNNGPRLLTNLKSEGVLEKKFAQRSCKQNRCILPASGFLEWLSEGKEKKPVLFELRDGNVFGLGGLYFDCKDGGRECVVLTTSPNTLISRVHNRMPVLITREHWEEWITLDDPAAALKRFAAPFPEQELQGVFLNRQISNSRFKGEIQREGVL